MTVGSFLNYKKSEKDKPKTSAAIAMDTAVSIKTWGADADALKKLVMDVDIKLNAFNSESELCKLNNSGSAEASETVLDITSKAVELCEKFSDVDVTSGELIELWNIGNDKANVPRDESIKTALKSVGNQNVEISGKTINLKNNARLNFGACAKGYTCDLIKNKLDDENAECAIISFGSSSLLYGKKPDGTRFKTAVVNPFSPSVNLFTFETDECFISTSGGYERYFEADGKKYSHIFDLKTGYPVETDIVSVTVICDSGIMSDVVSTAVYIGGTKKLGEYLASTDFSVIVVDENKNIYVSDEIKKDVEILQSEFKLV